MSRRSRFEWIKLRSLSRRTNRMRSAGLVAFGRRLRVEPLEERRMLAVFTVNNNNDAIVDSAGCRTGNASAGDLRRQQRRGGGHDQFRAVAHQRRAGDDHSPQR